VLCCGGNSSLSGRELRTNTHARQPLDSPLPQWNLLPLLPLHPLHPPPPSAARQSKKKCHRCALNPNNPTRQTDFWPRIFKAPAVTTTAISSRQRIMRASIRLHCSLLVASAQGRLRTSKQLLLPLPPLLYQLFFQRLSPSGGASL
jgi:hypothetical protein